MMEKIKSTDRKKMTTQKIKKNSQNSSLINKTRNFTPAEKTKTNSTLTPSYSTSTIITNNNLNTKPQKTNYEALRSLTEEISHVKEFCKEIKKKQDENCIMENEKNNFEKMKNEHIKLNADVNIIKEDIKEILSNYQNLVKRVESLEEENKSLRQHNKNLIKFIQGGENFTNYNTPFMNIVNEEEINYNKVRGNDQNNLKSHTYASNSFNHVNVEYSSPLSEMSAFNTVHNLSSMEMNNHINNCLELDKQKRRRFLIPKSDEMNYN